MDVNLPNERRCRNANYLLGVSKKSAKLRGLRGTTQAQVCPVRVIMREGEVIAPRRYNEIIRGGFSAESHVTAEQCLSQAGELANTNPGSTR